MVDGLGAGGSGYACVAEAAAAAGNVRHHPVVMNRLSVLVSGFRMIPVSSIQR
jgi:hypothetical protein